VTALYRGWLRVLGREPRAVYVKDCEGDFAALGEIKGIARSRGYAVGPLDIGGPDGAAFPAALFKGSGRIGKWRSLDGGARGRMSGIIVADSFQRGPVAMVEFQGGGDG